MTTELLNLITGTLLAFTGLTWFLTAGIRHYRKARA